MGSGRRTRRWMREGEEEEQEGIKGRPSEAALHA